MCKKLIVFCFVLFTATTSALAESITYIDATDGEGGNTLMLDEYYGWVTWVTNTTDTTDGIWRKLTGFGLPPDTTTIPPSPIPVSGSGTVYESRGFNPDDCPRLMTMVYGLNPSETYNVYVYFWNDAADSPYCIRASLEEEWPLPLWVPPGDPSIVQAGYDTMGRKLWQAYLGQVTGDLITVYVDDGPGESPARRTWYDGIGFGVPEIPEPPAVDFCGLTHWPLGNAQLNIDSNGFLAVSNIGSSGNDGTRVALPQNITSLHVNYLDVGDPYQFPVGSYIQATSTGTINGEPNQTVSTAKTVCTVTGEAVSTIDFSALGPNSLTAEYYLNRKLVLTEVNISPVSPAWSSIRIPNNVRITLKIRIRILPPGIRIIPDIHLTYCRLPLPFVTTPKGNVVQVDEIAVYAQDISVQFDGYTDMLLTAANIPSITITNETFSQCEVFLEGDADNDGVVGLGDIELISRQWLGDGMAADIYPEGSPDGFVNFGDVALLAQTWGIDCNTDPMNPACEPWP
ncbi:MAG: hypothetical protein JW749_12085 [Sedimentisphaerales bacterium]|nr:hypothetical protein [Sedimentisphaerales bacterium]